MLHSTHHNAAPSAHFQRLLATHEWSLCASEQPPWGLLRARPKSFERSEVPARSWPLDGVVLFSERVTSLLMVGAKSARHDPACVFVLDGVRVARAYALTLAHMMLESSSREEMPGTHGWLMEAITGLYDLLVSQSPSTFLASMRRPFHERARSVVERLEHREKGGEEIALRKLLVRGTRGVPDEVGTMARLIDLVMEPCPEGSAGDLFNAAYIAGAHGLALEHGCSGDPLTSQARDALIEASLERAAPLVFACCERLIEQGLTTRLA